MLRIDQIHRFDRTLLVNIFSDLGCCNVADQLSANHKLLRTASITKPPRRFQFVAGGRNSSNNNNNNNNKRKKNKNVLKQQRSNKKNKSWPFSAVKLPSSRDNQESNYTGDNFLLEDSQLSKSKSARRNSRPISWGALQTKKYFESSHGAERFLVEENTSLHHHCFQHRQNYQRSVL